MFHDTNIQNAILKNADISVASFKNVLLNGVNMSGVRGIEEAMITSINIGTIDNPMILNNEEAKNWMKAQVDK